MDPLDRIVREALAQPAAGEDPPVEIIELRGKVTVTSLAGGAVGLMITVGPAGCRREYRYRMTQGLAVLLMDALGQAARDTAQENGGG